MPEVFVLPVRYVTIQNLGNVCGSGRSFRIKKVRAFNLLKVKSRVFSLGNLRAVLGSLLLRIINLLKLTLLTFKICIFFVLSA